MKGFMGYHYLWDQKVSASHTELYQLISERKTSGYRIRP